MALPRHGPRRLQRPDDPAQDEEVASPPRLGTPASALVEVEAGTYEIAVRRRPAPRPDPAREALLRVLAVRGKPIDRRRGMVPSREFLRVAQAYILEHHYGYCLEFARSRSARHVPEEDMVQACLIGAYTALERFDKDHQHTYRFLSYAKWYLFMETNRLLHRDECLVVVPETVKRARGDLSRAGRDDLSDEEAARILDVPVEDVRAARDAYLGHDHRRVDERSRACRGGLEEARAAHDARAEALRGADGIAEALAKLDPMLRQVVWEEYGVGEDDPTAPRPATDAGRRSLRRMALRRLRAALEEV